jgi:hypothetical protein
MMAAMESAAAATAVSLTAAAAARAVARAAGWDQDTRATRA